MDSSGRLIAGKITAIKPQKRPGKFNVYVEGKFAFAIDSLNLVKRHLKVGAEISEEDVGEITKEVGFESDLEHVLHFLSFRPRSKREIEKYLAKKDLSKEEKEGVTGKVEELGLIDDKKFAEWWLGQRESFRPKGIRALKAELRRKGIESSVIEELKFMGESEEEKAYKLLKASWQRWSGEEGRKRREKAAGFLMRRGFKWEAVRRAIDRIGGGEVE